MERKGPPNSLSGPEQASSVQVEREAYASPPPAVIIVNIAVRIPDHLFRDGIKEQLTGMRAVIEVEHAVYFTRFGIR
jgi:hypothetical protein